MLERDVRTIEDAFAYSLDCNLATVSSMSMLKSRSKSEYERQINIAQKMLNWCILFDINLSTTRGNDIVKNFNKSVKNWAIQYDIKKNNKM